MIFYNVARENGVPQIKGTKEQQQAANDANPAAMVLANKLWRKTCAFWKILRAYNTKYEINVHLPDTNLRL